MYFKYSLIITLLFCSNVLFAQKEEVKKHKHYYHVTVNAENPEESSFQNIKGEEAENFDIPTFLAGQASTSQIRIIGKKTTQKEYTTYVYDSSKLEKNTDCSNFCEKIESIERVPYLGVAIFPMDDFSGVEVDYLLENSPLIGSGIVPGAVINSIDVNEISDPCNLVEAVSEQSIDSELGINYTLDGIPNYTTVKVGYRLKKKVTWVNCCELESSSDLPIHQDRMTLNVFPNPSSGLTNIEFSTSKLSETNIRLTDLSGRIIFQKKVLPLNGVWSDYLDLHTFGSGVYVLQIEQADEVLTERIVVLKE